MSKAQIQIPGNLTLDDTLTEAKRARVQVALADGCRSVREVAKHMDVSSSHAQRMLLRFGYTVEQRMQKEPRCPSKSKPKSRR